MPEKFFICKTCGDLTTEAKINEDIDNGGMGLCGCEYIRPEWNGKEFEPDYYKRYNDYTEIPENVYNYLREETNTVMRLWMLNSYLRSSRKPKIYLAAFSDYFAGPGYSGYALAEDGTGVCGHFSSSIDFAKHDLGLTSNWKHEHYIKHYPEGYELEWVDDPDNHEGWKKAMELNKRLEECKLKQNSKIVP